MIEKLTDYAIRQRFIIIILAVVVVGVGIFSAMNMPIDAFPDVTNNQVQVFTETPTLAALEVERLISFPIESVMNGIPGVTQVRSLSKNSLSIVTVVFDDSTNIYFARQQVFERLKLAEGRLPAGLAEPEMGPITTGMGQIYQYVVDGKDKDITDLRTLEDWSVKYQLRTVPGVTDILSFGGLVKQHQVLVDPAKLITYHIHLNDVFEALAKNNANVGGGFIEHSSEQYIVRGVGVAKTPQDIENIVIKAENGIPVYVRNVADVVVGPEVRQGAVSMNGRGEVVSGIVLQLKGENSRAVINKVKEKVVEINKNLPAGVKVKDYYDQAELVEKSVDTVKRALIEGGIMVILVLGLFLGNFRSALIVIASIIPAVLITFVLMRSQGLSANLMSLGGLAIGIGMMVDGSVVMVENIFRHLSERDNQHLSVVEIVIRAAREVARPVTFAIGIIIIVFLPIFTLQGIEAKMFTPMAYTKTYAMIGSLIVSLTLTPALCAMLLRPGVRESENFILRWVHRHYLPLLEKTLSKRALVVGCATTALVASVLIIPRLGSEFLPEMDEGSVMIRATLLPSVSLNQSLAMAQKMERILLTFPEATDVVSRIGRAEIGGDPEDVNNIEIYVGLRPKGDWKTARTKEALVDAMRTGLSDMPGAVYNFSQPIATRVDELISGVKAQIAVKLFGPDMDVLRQKADEIQKAVSSVNGVADLQVEQTAGLAQLNIEIDRNSIARYGINVSDVNDVIETAIAGRAASQLLEGDKRFDIVVRLPKNLREDVDRIKNLQVQSPGDEHIPLSQIARISMEEGPTAIQRENSQRRIVIQCNVRGRDMGGFVAEAQKAVASNVKLPSGYYVTWGGQFESQQRANARLAIVVPVTIFLIYLLLFINYNSLKNATLIVMNLPFALIGGIWGLYIRGMHMSVAASVGFIALFGVAVLNGVVMVSCFNQLRQEGYSLRDAVLTGVRLRLRPVLITALVASLGLVPLMFSNGTGSEVQKPLATVVVGGLITSTLLTLLVLPTLYGWFEEKSADVEV
ncbi:MAG: efflux RND transporter permease subunit [Armatimonadetes bacterium]|nr:efflux RND transporter permease subunit [Armatimonadota bacterium]